ncbi:RNA polymerase sigma factor [Streptomyces sp. Je 1-369]|uniref:RNA polymerase sigma factor n=1 Tax=Streptomyces sp. Je 1-369 TaxID=2966192 RepID=UPI002285DC94|nr:sigma-70 family RNA polymerase sigma factor [Streptomyces sp. Je 1-369]WAL98852.1 sigma-70 family RNA polymerase sigma factor [Streptomyces sp. Je 1-369]
MVAVDIPNPDDSPVPVNLLGDDQLAAAYRRWGRLVHQLARRGLGDGPDAEDVTQQVFLAAWRGRHGYRPGAGGLAGWLVGITRHKVADALAARARRAVLVAAVGARQETPPLGGSGPEQVLDRVLVQRELALLPSPQQLVLRLAFYGDLSQSQISERTGLPLGTVKSHTRRGLRALREGLASADPPGADVPEQVCGERIRSARSA